MPTMSDELWMITMPESDMLVNIKHCALPKFTLLLIASHPPLRRRCPMGAV